MAGWHHQCNGHELGQTLGDGERQGGLLHCSSWSCNQSDMTEQLELYCDIFFLVYGQLILVIMLYSGF